MASAASRKPRTLPRPSPSLQDAAVAIRALGRPRVRGPFPRLRYLVRSIDWQADAPFHWTARLTMQPFSLWSVFPMLHGYLEDTKVADDGPPHEVTSMELTLRLLVLEWRIGVSTKDPFNTGADPHWLWYLANLLGAGALIYALT